MFPERRFIKACKMLYRIYVSTTCKTRRTVTLSALQPKQSIPTDKYQRIAAAHNFNIGQWGHALTKYKLNNFSITDQMILKFIRQCHVVGYYTWISFTTTWGPMQWRPWYLLHTSTTYGESLPRFSSEFFYPSLNCDGSFSRWFLVDETPHISVPTALCIIFFTSCISHTPCISMDQPPVWWTSVVDQPPKGGGIVTQ